MAEASDKQQIKRQIQEAKVRRQGALEARDSTQLKRALREIHGLKRRLRRMAALTQ